jgi:hypothetical protein
MLCAVLGRQGLRLELGHRRQVVVASEGRKIDVYISSNLTRIEGVANR